MCNVHCTYLLYTTYNVYTEKHYIVSVTFVQHNSIAMQYYPSEYDPLHVEKSYLITPKLVV